ncbi:MAG: hypothetical protein AAB421_00855 [Patescibacteria group bacterium]
MRIKNNQRGFTLLLATITASLLLILGAAIFSITKKEVMLSSIGRDSQFAFYAADTAAECALYWDVRHDAFSSTTSFTTATCDAQSLGALTFVAYGTPMTFEYQPNGYCARVSVTKNNDPNQPETTVYSRGYNSTCLGIETNPRALERAVQLTY